MILQLSHPSNSIPQEAWEQVIKTFKNQIGINEFNRWFQHIIVDFDNDKCLIQTPDEMSIAWIEANYLDELKAILPLISSCHSVFDIEFGIQQSRLEVPISSSLTKENTGPPKSLSEKSGAKKLASIDTCVEQHEQLAKKKSTKIKRSGLNPVNNFSRFVVSDHNNFAFAAATAILNEETLTYNPFFIYGNSGLGKTHLMQAIGLELLEQNINAKVLYTSAENFTNDYVQAIQNNQLDNLRNRYRNLDVLLIDDIQFLANKTKTQDEFFHTFEALINSQAQIILSSDVSIHDLKQLSPRLVSRLSAGLCVQIETPSYETRLAILEKHLSTTKHHIDSACLELIASEIKSDIRNLMGAINKLLIYVSLQPNQNFHVDTVKALLQDCFQQEKTQLKLNTKAIQKTIANYYNINFEDLVGKRRTSQLTLPRHVAMYLTRDLTSASLHEIGHDFNRDHGTIIHACKCINSRITTEEGFKETIDFLKNKFT